MVAIAGWGLIFAGLAAIERAYHPGRDWWIRTAILMSPLWITPAVILILYIVEKPSRQ
jgi:hypothetical protein